MEPIYSPTFTKHSHLLYILTMDPGFRFFQGRDFFLVTAASRTKFCASMVINRDTAIYMRLFFTFVVNRNHKNKMDGFISAIHTRSSVRVK